jgi:hypothetical protein
MFRALAALIFIVMILPSAALVAFLVMKALGVSGVLGFIVGFPVFVGILTVSVILLAAINDRINNRDIEGKNHHRTYMNGAH